jgi:hypothetical protein
MLLRGVDSPKLLFHALGEEYGVKVKSSSPKSDWRKLVMMGQRPTSAIKWCESTTEPSERRAWTTPEP